MSRNSRPSLAVAFDIIEHEPMYSCVEALPPADIFRPGKDFVSGANRGPGPRPKPVKVKRVKRSKRARVGE